MSNIKGPLISSQRYLDKAKVNNRAARFKRFIVSVYPIVLRGQQYTILMDGHHNYAAAKLAGIEPDYEVIKGILPTTNPDEYACCIAADMWNACRADMFQGGQPVSNRDELSSPVIPDGYALVPIVPTEDMVINGFESEPDPHFSDEKVWAEYEALSGCRRAARRAELCWAAMIKAAPKQEGNNG
ncbi:ParB/RepB/Spo0J family partition protein [Salmonella enterica]|nr:ParB/RepB/Spo0J family partition protein [Salmonella enterica]EAX6581988.1 ParB/RepB/Spo0J family partition protein [Salmonella enterica]